MSNIPDGYTAADLRAQFDRELNLYETGSPALVGIGGVLNMVIGLLQEQERRIADLNIAMEMFCGPRYETIKETSTADALREVARELSLRALRLAELTGSPVTVDVIAALGERLNAAVAAVVDEKP